MAGGAPRSRGEHHRALGLTALLGTGLLPGLRVLMAQRAGTLRQQAQIRRVIAFARGGRHQQWPLPVEADGDSVGPSSESAAAEGEDLRTAPL